MLLRAAIARPVVLLGVLANRPIDLRFASSALSRATPLCSFKEPTLVPPPHPATIPPEDVQRDCSVTHTKGSGPGGQHRNKVQTAVVLKHRPTGLTGSASDSRSQTQNAAAALFRLRLRFALELRSGLTEQPVASALWRGRIDKAGRLKVNEAHQDFPALLSEALDCFWYTKDVKEAAATLGVSNSQLLKFLKQEPRAFQLVNGVRASKGLKPLT